MTTLTIGSFAITVHAHDHAGVYGRLHADNTVLARRSVTVRDTTRPVVHIDGLRPAMSECSHAYLDEGAHCTDNLDTPLGLDIPVTDNHSDIDVMVLGDHAVTYQCTDSHGNVAMPVKRKVAIVDTTPPTLSWTAGYGAQIVHHSQRDNPINDP